jgi:hypothetical protein
VNFFFLLFWIFDSLYHFTKRGFFRLPIKVCSAPTIAYVGLLMIALPSPSHGLQSPTKKTLAFPNHA